MAEIRAGGHVIGAHGWEPADLQAEEPAEKPKPVRKRTDRKRTARKPAAPEPTALAADDEPVAPPEDEE